MCAIKCWCFILFDLMYNTSYLCGDPVQICDRYPQFTFHSKIALSKNGCVQRTANRLRFSTLRYRSTIVNTSQGAVLNENGMKMWRDPWVFTTASKWLQQLENRKVFFLIQLELWDHLSFYYQNCLNPPMVVKEDDRWVTNPLLCYLKWKSCETQWCPWWHEVGSCIRC